MNSKAFFTAGALIALAFGLAFLVAPSAVMTVYGVESTLLLTVAYRYFGVALVTVFAVIWPIRACRDPAIVRPLLLGHGVGDAAGLLVSVWAVTSGAMNVLGWLNVLLYLGLIGGAAYCYMAPAQRPFAAA